MLMRLWQNEIERRLSSLENQGGSNADLGALDLASIDLGEDGAAAILALQARIAELEAKQAEDERRISSVESQTLDSGQSVGLTDSMSEEIERLKKFIIILKAQHPYEKFPPGP